MKKLRRLVISRLNSFSHEFVVPIRQMALKRTIKKVQLSRGTTVVDYHCIQHIDIVRYRCTRLSPIANIANIDYIDI